MEREEKRTDRDRTGHVVREHSRAKQDRTDCERTEPNKPGQGRLGEKRRDQKLTGHIGRTRTKTNQDRAGWENTEQKRYRAGHSAKA